MIIDLFRLIVVLFFCCLTAASGQSSDNPVAIELSSTSFPMERPFTISIILRNSDSRPSIAFPDIAGLQKRGTTTSVTTSEVSGKTVVSQVITQTYFAERPGTYRLAPFSVTLEGATIRSEGATLTVRPGNTPTAPGSATALNGQLPLPPAKSDAFLALTTSRRSVYAGEGFSLKLSFFVADTYPYELQFDRLDEQLQRIVKQIHPANAWEENVGISELRPVPVVLNGRAFKEYRLYQATFFPLSAQAIRLPPVPLTLLSTRPAVAGLPAPKPQPTRFVSEGALITVRPLPPHPLREKVAVGRFRLTDALSRRTVRVGESARYEIRIEGEGNIAALPEPARQPTTNLDVFPPDVRQTVNRTGGRVTGQKLFRYYLVTHANGAYAMANTFHWIYFDPQTARYDTLRPTALLNVGNVTAAAAGLPPDTVRNTLANSIYSGLEALDSTQQPINFPVLIRAVANVLIVILILGTIFVFFKK